MPKGIKQIPTSVRKGAITMSAQIVLASIKGCLTQELNMPKTDSIKISRALLCEGEKDCIQGH